MINPKYIKNNQGIKVEKVVTSINLEKRHMDFVRQRNIVLSMLVRDVIESMMKEESEAV